MAYILIVDDESDIREILEVGISAAFPLNVVLADSGQSALEIIKSKGRPEIIISDYRMPNGDGLFLLNCLKDLGLNVPFVICSGNPLTELQQLFPNIHGYVEKPKILNEIKRLIGNVVTKHESPPVYVPVRISLLLRLGQVEFDIFMKLSDDNFIKVTNQGELFVESDAERFYKKNIIHLFIALSDASKYLNAFEKNLAMMMESHDLGNEEKVKISFDSIEFLERFSTTLGWTPELVESAKKTVELAINTLSKEPNILSYLQSRLSNSKSEYSRHVTMLSMMSCLFCQQIGWTSEGTQMKLAMAALIHDFGVDEIYYKDIEFWNKKVREGTDKSPEVSKYKNHPIDAANIIQTIKNLPPDVDQIILQHHELRDGTGFPRKLAHNRISPLSTVFIITEDLVDAVSDGVDLEKKIKDFIISREEIYSAGNFKKVFSAIQGKLKVYLENV